MRADKVGRSDENAGPSKVSRAEEAQFGPLARPLRHLGLMVASVEDAQALLSGLLEESHRGDELTRSKTKPTVKLDEQGRSEHTRMLESMWERVNELHRATRGTFQELSLEAIKNWTTHQLGAVPVPDRIEQPVGIVR